MAETRKQARLEARVNPDILLLIKRAAEIEGRSVTDFVVAAASEAAKITIERTEVITLSREDAEAFARSLLNPKPMAPAMARAHEHHKRLIGGV